MNKQLLIFDNKYVTRAETTVPKPQKEVDEKYLGTTFSKPHKEAEKKHPQDNVEIESNRYGVGKPTRIVIKAKIIND